MRPHESSVYDRPSRLRARLVPQSSQGRTRHFQIGPRIRVGGTLGKIGQTLKEKVLPSPASMLGGAVLGPVGSLVGSAANGSIGSDFGKGLANAAAMVGPGALAGAAKAIPGVSALGSAVQSIPGVGAIEGAAQGVGSALSSIPGVQSVEQYLQQHGGLGSVLGGAAKDVGGFLTGNGGRNALGLAEGVNAAMLEKKSEDYAKNAMGTAQSSYDARSPLRAAGIQGMLQPNVPNLQPLAQSDTGNPYTSRTPYPQAPAVKPLQG